MTTPTFDLGLLLDMLTYCRPARSPMVAVFCDRFIAPLPGATIDAYGNWHVTIGDSPILWSAHTDTVHSSKGPDRQTLHLTGEGIIRLSKRSRKASRCLGADDTAGVFLLVCLIRAGVPGHYIFHHAEEIGGIGSSDLAEHAPDLLNGSTFAIALDRKGTRDVITHQWSRCCSTAFAQSLADQLNRYGLDYRPDETGVFTDTANYTAIVPECTNLSVGYAKAHTEDETLDTYHLRVLLPALAALDPAALVSERLVTDEEFELDTRWTTIGPSTAHTDSGWNRSAPGRVLPFDQSDADAICEACEYLYRSNTSTADNQAEFCCKECEHWSLYVQTTEQEFRNPDAVYLDENYAAIQDAIAIAVDALPIRRDRKAH